MLEIIAKQCYSPPKVFPWVGCSKLHYDELIHQQAHESNTELGYDCASHETDEGNKVRNGMKCVFNSFENHECNGLDHCVLICLWMCTARHIRRGEITCYRKSRAAHVAVSE
jgi:hypothetical protein